MKRSIGEDEYELIGKLLLQNNRLVEDETSARINFLTNNYLKKIAISISGWEILYRDETDNRFWELIYSHSELQGGGVPTLINITKENAIIKYRLKST
jgi:hypothetical protein